MGKAKSAAKVATNEAEKQAPVAEAATTAIEVQKPAGALAVPYDYGDLAGAGYEDQSMQDVVVPFLEILQPLSPECDPSKPEQNVPGAAAGMFHNTATGQCYDGKEGVLFVPAFTRHVFSCFTPRKQGGGYKGEFPVDHATVEWAKKDLEERQKRDPGNKENRFGRYKTPDGDDLVETFQIWGVVCAGDDVEGYAVLAAKSTMIRQYKAAMTAMRAVSVRHPDGTKKPPPMFSNLIRLTTFGMRNSEGSWFNINIRPANKSTRESLMSPEDGRFQAGHELLQLFRSGKAKMDEKAASKPSGGAGASEESPF